MSWAKRPFLYTDHALRGDLTFTRTLIRERDYEGALLLMRSVSAYLVLDLRAAASARGLA